MLLLMNHCVHHLLIVSAFFGDDGEASLFLLLQRLLLLTGERAIPTVVHFMVLVLVVCGFLKEVRCKFWDSSPTELNSEESCVLLA